MITVIVSATSCKGILKQSGLFKEVTVRILSVQQGECKVSADADIAFSTVLGSCVAVCLHDKISLVGGMNHFLLPGTSSNGRVDTRFGVNSMELLINEMLKKGAQRYRFFASIFGGSQLINEKSFIGKSNIDFAESFLANEGISIHSRDTGGNQARRVRFIPVSGEATCVKVTAPKGLGHTERAFQKQRKQTEVTLF